VRRAILGALLLVACLELRACCSTPVGNDPATNVTAGNYREALARIQSNLSANVVPSLEKMRDEDLARPAPAHRPEWWKAKIGLVEDSAILCSTTLSGSKAGQKP
jgi:hypothetical protein